MPHRIARGVSLASLALLSAFVLSTPVSAAELTLKPGEHISLIGNNLADRMQHHGWLETYIQAAFPKHQLSFRNLGFTGDEIDKRPRSNNFGAPDAWLTRCKTDVVFAFFGYNEALKGEGGLSSFKQKLASLIDHTQKQKYNGQGDKGTAARIVLFSPIAHEDLNNPNLPDGSANNANLAKYTQAMAEVAKAKVVPFVDLFNPTKKLYASAKKPLTFNGIHLLPHGNQAVAKVIMSQLFPKAKVDMTAAQLEKLRQAVIEKNFHWFNLYRTVDGYNVYGGRSRLSWHGQSNADVMQREMDVFEVMTANRQKRVWAVAQGGDMKVDDSNAPPLLEVKTNRPGKLEGGKYEYIDGEAAIDKMTVAKGMEINLFASEEMFPDLINPVQMAVDTDGRLWAATWPTYPHWRPNEELKDKLVILPDENGDGKADKLIVFAEGLNSITGFEFWGGGVIVATAPELLFLKDTDGDDKADVKIRILQGVSSADTHHTANAFVMGPHGGIYWSRGVFHVTNMETPTKTFRSGSSGVYRFDPRTFEIDFHFPIGPNPHGIAFDQWGYQFATDGTSGTGRHIAIGKGVGSHKTFYQKRVRPVPASGILSSSHFPPENQGNFLICNAIGFLGVLQHEFSYEGADITAKEIEPIVVSKDPNFRPSDIEVAGDGALYIADWHQALIGHMQHNIRDPNRDHLHGRIYRVTYKGRKLLKPVKLKNKPIPEVLQAFYAKENGVRYRARIELSGRKTDDVVKAVNAFASGISTGSPEHEQALLECLWTFAEHRVPNLSLLEKVAQANEPRIRAAAIRTLGHWGDTGKVTEGWEQTLVAASRDESALVRAQAALAAVYFANSESGGIAAADAVFEVSTRKTDPQIDAILKYTRSKINLDRIVSDAVNAGKKLSPSALAYAMQKADVRTLLKLPRSKSVYEAILARAGVGMKDRAEALAFLAKQNSRSADAELIAAITSAEANKLDGLDDLLQMLAAKKPGELAAQSAALAKLTAETKSSDVRQQAYAAWVDAAQDAGPAFAHAAQRPATMRDLLLAYNSLQSDKARRGLHNKVRATLFNWPKQLREKETSTVVATGGLQAKYFLPSKGNSELKRYTNVKPTQTVPSKQFRFDEVPIKNRSADFALVFEGSIMAPASGEYTFYTRSDDGSRLYINGKQVVNNGGKHGMAERSGKVRLQEGTHAITVTYFNSGGGNGLVVSWAGPGLKKQEIPAAVLSGGAGGSLKDLALAVVAHGPGSLEEKVADMLKLMASEDMASPALNAIASLPPYRVAPALKKPQVTAVLGAVFATADKATPVQRQGGAFGRLLSLGDALVKVSPGDKRAQRKKLGALRNSIPAQADPAVMALGREVYTRESHCATCHQPNGQGLPNLYPPINDSKWVTGSENRLIAMTLNGMHGTIEVKGKTYSSPPLPPMTGFRNLLNDEELAAVLTYVRNSWSNRAKPIEAKQVATVRKQYSKRSDFWDAYELLQKYPMEDGSTPAKKPESQGGWVPKFVKEWKTGDFNKKELDSLSSRSFEKGKLAFDRLGCIQCHQLNKQGGSLGPDLTEVLKKWKGDRHALLKQIIEPSAVIDEKYKAFELDTFEGRITGLILSRTKDHLMVVSNPQNPKPQKIAMEDVDAMKPSSQSLMPGGLLNMLEKQDILDLMAFLIAGGDKGHAVFKK